MKNANSFCVRVIKIVISLTTALLLCVYSGMTKRVKVAYTVVHVVCAKKNELIR